MERRGTECDRALRPATRGSALEEEEEGEWRGERGEGNGDGRRRKHEKEERRSLCGHARTHARRRVFISLMSITEKKVIWNSLERQDMKFLRGSERKSLEGGPRTKHRKSYM